MEPIIGVIVLTTIGISLFVILTFNNESGRKQTNAFKDSVYYSQIAKLNRLYDHYEKPISHVTKSKNIPGLEIHYTVQSKIKYYKAFAVEVSWYYIYHNQKIVTERNQEMITEDQLDHNTKNIKDEILPMYVEEWEAIFNER